MCRQSSVSCFFFFNDPATTEIYTLSLHDALPIFFGTHHTVTFDTTAATRTATLPTPTGANIGAMFICEKVGSETDRKSTRLNSSHANISYAVFCLKKKKYTYMFIPLYPPSLLFHY